MAASKSSSSWNRHYSAIRCLEQFIVVTNSPLYWPVSKTLLRSFVQWALHKKQLNPSTVRQYLSDTVHHLKDLDTGNFNDFFVKSMIKGAGNLALYNSISSQARLVMTLPLLKILGHEIAACSWAENSRRVFWTACCVAFFGSFRMGEILPPEKTDTVKKPLNGTV
jgi:hypothetical protein